MDSGVDTLTKTSKKEVVVAPKANLLTPIDSINKFAEETGIGFRMLDLTSQYKEVEIGDSFLVVRMYPVDPNEVVGSEQYDGIASLQFKMLDIAKETGNGRVYFQVDAPKAKFDTSGTKFMGIAQKLDRDVNFGWEVIVAENFMAQVMMGSAMELFSKLFHLTKFSARGSEKEAREDIIKAIKSAPRVHSSF